MTLKETDAKRELSVYLMMSGLININVTLHTVTRKHVVMLVYIVVDTTYT